MPDTTVGPPNADDWSPRKQIRLMQDMTEPELSEHLSRQLRFIKASQTSDTVGSMLIIFQNDGICQYGATVAWSSLGQS